MVAFEKKGALESLIREILASSDHNAKVPSIRTVARDFNTAEHRDYPARITSLFDYQEMREILRSFRKALPAVNTQIFSDREPRRLARVATELGTRFLISRFDGESGKALRGFYVNDRAVSKGPLICLNGSGHPSAVASAFWHEVGHHLTSRAFGVSRPLKLSFSKLYEDHLDDPVETAADVLAVLGGYPEPVARRMFARFEKSGRTPEVNDLVSLGREHLRSQVRFDFRQIKSATESLQYLAGMIHLIRLRWVLYSEYDI